MEKDLPCAKLYKELIPWPILCEEKSFYRPTQRLKLCATVAEYINSETIS